MTQSSQVTLQTRIISSLLCLVKGLADIVGRLTVFGCFPAQISDEPQITHSGRIIVCLHFLKQVVCILDTHKHKEKHRDKEHRHKDHKKEKEREKVKYNNR